MWAPVSQIKLLPIGGWICLGLLMPGIAHAQLAVWCNGVRYWGACPQAAPPAYYRNYIPPPPPPPPPPAYVTTRTQADELYRGGKFAEAEAAYQQAKQLCDQAMAGQLQNICMSIDIAGQNARAAARKQRANEIDAGGVSAFKAGDYARAEAAFRAALAAGGDAETKANLAQHLRDTLVTEANAAIARGDYAVALNYLRMSQQIRSDDPAVADAVAWLQQEIAFHDRLSAAEQQNRVNGDQIRQQLQVMANGFDLMRDGPNSGAAPVMLIPGGGAAVGGVSGDAMIVDAGVQKWGADFVAGLKLPNPDLAERTRKGLQAAANHDWPVALAWWQDALDRDPNNPVLKRSVDLARWMVAQRQQTGWVASKPVDDAFAAWAKGDAAQAQRLIKQAQPKSLSVTDADLMLLFDDAPIFRQTPSSTKAPPVPSLPDFDPAQTADTGLDWQKLNPEAQMEIALLVRRRAGVETEKMIYALFGMTIGLDRDGTLQAEAQALGKAKGLFILSP
jgi:tetratricopeptide (TPR) repeat protein